MMNRNVSFIGSIGLVVFLFGLFTTYFLFPAQYSMAEDPGLITGIHLLFGLLCIVYFVLKVVSVFFSKEGFSSLGSSRAKRVAGFGVSVTVYSGLFLGIIIFFNYLVVRHNPFHYDSTEQKVYTLAPQTKKVLASLPENLSIRAFYVGARVEPKVEDLLNRISEASQKVRWEAVDPEKRPELVEKYGISEKGTVHFSFDVEGSSREAKIARNITEQEVVNAILKLTRGGEKKVYWVSGHGESNLDEETEAGYLFLKEAIEGESLQIEKLALGEVLDVPKDASALLLMGPRRSLLPREKESIQRYLSRGGNALLLNEANTIADVREIAAPLGIEVGEDVILDQVVQLFAGPSMGVQPVVSTYAAHTATHEFKESTIFSTVTSVRKGKNVPEGADVVELAFTGSNSWAEKKLDLVFSEEPQAAKEEDDIAGPVSVAVAFEGKVPAEIIKNADGEGNESPQKVFGEKSRVVVIGDADFVANVNIRQLFNRDFFLNTLNWVVGEDGGITLRERTLRASTTRLTPEQFRRIFLVTGVFLPELLLLWGISVWWYRNG